MNYVSLHKIQQRLQKIIANIICELDHTQLYGLDESKLEDLQNFIKEIISPKKKTILPKEEHIKRETAKIRVPKASYLPKMKLVEGNRDDLNIYAMSEKGTIQQTAKFKFDQSLLKKFCSLAQISEDKFIISGGCMHNNPNIKSDEIMSLDLLSGQITPEGTLVEAVSSHVSVFAEPLLYIIGGKRQDGAITRSCCAFNIYSKETFEIDQLNFAAASAAATLWRDKFIYKVGGLGECFGEWSVSPYIERYCIEQNFWEVINPIIPAEHGLTSEFQLYAYSLVYISVADELVILGGFNDDKNPTDFGCVLKVSEDHHAILEYGKVQGLQPGGFWNPQYLGFQKQIISLQTCTTPVFCIKLATVPTK